MWRRRAPGRACPPRAATGEETHDRDGDGTDRAEIDFSVYDPYIDGVRPATRGRRWTGCCDEYPVAYHRDLGMLDGRAARPGAGGDAQPAVQHPLRRLGARAAAQAPVGVEPLQRGAGSSTCRTSRPSGHKRLRRLTAPAFSRRVMDLIEAAHPRLDRRGLRRDPRPAPVRRRRRHRRQGPDPGHRPHGRRALRRRHPVRARPGLEPRPGHQPAVRRRGAGAVTGRAPSPGCEYLIETVREAPQRRPRATTSSARWSTPRSTASGCTTSRSSRCSSRLISAGADTAVDLHTHGAAGLPDPPRPVGAARRAAGAVRGAPSSRRCAGAPWASSAPSRASPGRTSRSAGRCCRRGRSSTPARARVGGPEEVARAAPLRHHPQPRRQPRLRRRARTCASGSTWSRCRAG